MNNKWYVTIFVIFVIILLGLGFATLRSIDEEVYQKQDLQQDSFLIMQYTTSPISNTFTLTTEQILNIYHEGYLSGMITFSDAILKDSTLTDIQTNLSLQWQKDSLNIVKRYTNE